MSARSNRLRDGVGSSWGELEHDSDPDFVQYSSDADSDLEYDGDTDKDFEHENKDKATPLHYTATYDTPSEIRHTPRNTPNRTPARFSQINSSRSTPRSTASKQATPGSAEPSFIMPSMNNSMNDYATGSPLQKSQIRSRKRQESFENGIPGGSPRFSSRRSSKTSKPEAQQEELGPWHYVSVFYENIALPLLTYVFDVFGYANRHFFKPVLGFLLGVSIIWFAIHLASGLVHSKINAALAPVCLIPGSSYLFSMCATTQHDNQANFEELINVQSHFEEILDASKDTSTLPATLKDSEIAIRDLRALVKHSRLPSRNQLDLEFHNFVLTAKEAANDLSRYNSRIGSTLDRVIATNTWTMAVLQGLEESEANKGSLARVFNAVTGTFIAPPPTLQQRIFDQYVSHVSKNKEEITSLIETAQALLIVLTNLDERLDTIYSITVNDDETISRTQDELLSSLWTKLGGNSASVKANSRHLNLLKNISQYRRKALKHVSETLLKLQEIQVELENLRDGVAAPEVLGWREGVPITYHVELVEKGVERLRMARGESMRVEGEMLRNRIRGGEAGQDGVRELGDGKGMPVVTVRAK